MVQQQDVHAVGWFDLVVLRHSRRVSGITDLSINSIDVLTGLDTVKICTAYELDGEEITEYPANLDQLRRCKTNLRRTSRLDRRYHRLPQFRRTP